MDEDFPVRVGDVFVGQPIEMEVSEGLKEISSLIKMQTPFFMTFQYISIIHQLIFNPCCVIFVFIRHARGLCYDGKPCGEDLAEGRPSQVHRRTMVLPHRGGGGAKHPWRGSPPQQKMTLRDVSGTKEMWVHPKNLMDPWNIWVHIYMTM